MLLLIVLVALSTMFKVVHMLPVPVLMHASKHGIKKKLCDILPLPYISRLSSCILLSPTSRFFC